MVQAQRPFCTSNLFHFLILGWLLLGRHQLSSQGSYCWIALSLTLSHTHTHTHTHRKAFCSGRACTSVKQQFAVASRLTVLLMQSSSTALALRANLSIVQFNSKVVLVQRKTFCTRGNCHLSTRVGAASPVDPHSLRNVQLLFQLLHDCHGTVLGLDDSHSTELGPGAGYQAP